MTKIAFFLDLHERLGGTGTGTGALDEVQVGENARRLRSPTRLDGHQISVWNVVEIALSTELHIAVIISCVFPYQFSYFSSLILA
jgi:hypothetical protein